MMNLMRIKQLNGRVSCGEKNPEPLRAKNPSPLYAIKASGRALAVNCTLC
jgi:hypothetical protein